MPTKLPRLNVVMDLRLYRGILKLSRKEGLSMSLVARDLLKEALALYEDVYWGRQAEKREATFTRKKALTHERVWHLDS